MFVQLLVQQVAGNYFINLADDIEPISKSVLNINLSWEIIIQAKMKIVEKVKKHCLGNVF